MSKIMIDLDVITVAEWEKEDYRKSRLLSWKHLELVKKIATQQPKEKT